MVLAGGGQVARSEALEAARRGWPVFAIAGTGGLADDLLADRQTYRVGRRRLAAAVLPGKLRYRPLPPASGIGDPDLREIVLQADIRPVTGTDPKMLGRELAWELQEEPILKRAWESFATYDHLAIRLRRMSTRFQAAILALGVTATLLGLVYSQVKESWLYWVVVVLPILVSVLIAVASRRAVGQRWLMLRAAAESIKAAIYRYRTLRTASAADAARAAAVRQRELASQLEVIERRLMRTEASSGPLTPYHGPLPPRMYGASQYDDGLSPLGAVRYLQIRVGDQLSYFNQRIRTLNRRRNLLQLLAIGSGAAGAILAADKLEAWIGLCAGVSAAALAYLGFLQLDNTIVTYNQTASRITGLERRWRALSRAQQDDAAFRRLVADCESALSTELYGWVQQMNDAFQDLRHDQASEASRIEVAGDSGSQPRTSAGLRD
jgi:hypothetical protein